MGKVLHSNKVKFPIIAVILFLAYLVVDNLYLVDVIRFMLDKVNNYVAMVLPIVGLLAVIVVLCCKRHNWILFLATVIMFVANLTRIDEWDVAPLVLMLYMGLCTLLPRTKENRWIRKLWFIPGIVSFLVYVLSYIESMYYWFQSMDITFETSYYYDYTYMLFNGAYYVGFFQIAAYLALCFWAAYPFKKGKKAKAVAKPVTEKADDKAAVAQVTAPQAKTEDAPAKEQEKPDSEEQVAPEEPAADQPAPEEPETETV